MIRTTLLYAAFTLFAVAYAVLTPPGDAPDEMPHFQHVDFLLHERRIPHRFEDDIYQDHHPPLYYAAGAAALRLGQALDPRFSFTLPGPYRISVDLGEPVVDRETVERAAAAVPPALRAELAAKANLKERYFEVTRGQFVVLRLLSVVLALLTLVCVHRAVRLILAPGATARSAGPPAAVTLSLAFAALLPQFQFLGGIVNCDIMAVFTANLLLYRLTRALVAGDLATVRRGFEIGAFLGLCLLSKMSGIAMLAPVGLAFLFTVRLAGPRRAAAGLATALGTALLVGGWWYALNAVRYGDPFMVAAQAATMGEQIHQPPLHGHYFAAYLHDTLRSFFGCLGQLSIPIADWIFYAFTALMGLAGAGLLLRVVPRRFAARTDAGAPPAARSTELAPGGTAALWVLGAGFFATWIVVFRGNLTFYSFQGRYLFPGLVAVAAAFGLGLTEALRPRLVLRALVYLFLGAAALHVFAFRFLPRYFPHRDAVDRPLVVRYEDAGHPHLSRARTAGRPVGAWGSFGGLANPDVTTVQGDRIGFHFDRLPPAEAYRVRVRFGEYLVLPTPWRYPLQSLRLNGTTVAGALMVAASAREAVYPVPVLPEDTNAISVEAAVVPGYGPLATASAVWIERAPLQPRGLAVRGGAVMRGRPLAAELTVANIHPSDPQRGRVGLVLIHGRRAVRLGEPTAFTVAPGREARIRLEPKLPPDALAGRGRVLAFLALEPGSPYIDLNPCITRGFDGTIRPSRTAFGRYALPGAAESGTGDPKAGDRPNAPSMHVSLPLPALPAGRYRVRVSGRSGGEGDWRLEARLRHHLHREGGPHGSGWQWADASGHAPAGEVREVEIGGTVDWPPGVTNGEIEIRGRGDLAVDRLRVVAEWVPGVNLIAFPHESNIDVR